MGIKGHINKYDLFNGIPSKEYITPQMFGAKGDGINDDTRAVQEASKYLTDNKTLYFPKGIYRFGISNGGASAVTNSKNAFIQLRNLKNATIDLGDSTIIADCNHARKPTDSVNSSGVSVTATEDIEGYHVIDILDCENFIIKNGIIKGDRISHKYGGKKIIQKNSVATVVDKTHEFGYGIYVYSSSEKVCSGIIDNIECCDMIGDGVVTKNGVGSGKIWVKNCEIHHNRRQGISILDSDEVALENIKIHDIGDTEHDGIKIQGAFPKSGIDIEPDSGSNVVKKVNIYNCNIYNVDGKSIVAVGRNGVFANLEELTIQDCDIEGRIIVKAKNLNDIVNVKLFMDEEQDDPTFETVTMEEVTTIASENREFKVVNCYFKVSRGSFNLEGVELTKKCKGIYNSTFEGFHEKYWVKNDNIKTYTRLHAYFNLYNCTFKNITLWSAGGGEKTFKSAHNCSFIDCSFMFYGKAGRFTNCFFNNGCKIVVQEAPSKDGEDIINFDTGSDFYCCVLDKLFFTRNDLYKNKYDGSVVENKLFLDGKYNCVVNTDKSLTIDELE